MAFNNMFGERVEKFNEENENRELTKLLSDEKAREEIKWETYSVEEIRNMFHVTDEEAGKLIKSNLFKIYRVGNEYRASKKSVEENRRIVEVVLNYRDKKTITVGDMRRILGLGKTAAYRLINKRRFKTYLVFGKIRIDVASFEEWYAGQFHYKKVNGQRPGMKHGDTISPTTVAKVLGIPRSTANDLMNNRLIEFVEVNGNRRIIRESFEKWYTSQNRYMKVKEVEEVEGYVN